MKKISYIKQIETEDEMGDKIYLYYFISDSADSEEKSYGVGVDMYTQKYNERTHRVRKTVNNIFKTRLEAELFAGLLCRSTVTPTTLEDVVEDSLKAGLA